MCKLLSTKMPIKLLHLFSNLPHLPSCGIFKFATYFEICMRFVLWEVLPICHILINLPQLDQFATSWEFATSLEDSPTFATTVEIYSWIR